MKSKNLRHKFSGLSDNSLMATLMTVSTLLVAISFVLCRLWLGDIRFNSKVISQKNEANRTLEQNVAAIPQLQSNFQALQAGDPKPELVLEALPPHEEFSALAKNLEAVSSLAGAQLLSVVRSSAEVVPIDNNAAPTPQPLDVQASVTGTYAELQRLIGLLEQNVRPLRLNRAIFNGVEPNVTLNLELTTWWQPPTTVEGATEVITE